MFCQTQTARSKLRKVLFLALSVTFLFFFILFVNQISPEPSNGLAPNSQGRRVCSLARTSLYQGQRSKVKVTRDKNALSLPSTPAATEWNALAAINVVQQQTAPCCHYRGISADCVRCMFSKTPLALVSLKFLFERFTRMRQTTYEYTACTTNNTLFHCIAFHVICIMRLLSQTVLEWRNGMTF